ncbi:MAG: RibD family protein [Chloroflexota bacterium]
MAVARRPYVTVHYAQTLDGRIATNSGRARWISCAESLSYSHQLRALNDAVMVGIGTILADDPLLTVRLSEGPSPLRIVLDSALRLPLDARVVTERPDQTIVATCEGVRPERVASMRQAGVEVLAVGANHQRVALDELLPELGRKGIHTLLVEGGAGVITAMLRAGVVDRMVVCVAPKILGSGLDAVGDLQINDLADAVTFKHMDLNLMGSDIVLDGEIARD